MRCGVPSLIRFLRPMVKGSENSYRLAKEICRVGFKTADSLAKQLEIAEDSPLRSQARIEHALWELNLEGNTCYPEAELVTEAPKMLDVYEKFIKDLVIDRTLEFICVKTLKGYEIPKDDINIYSNTQLARKLQKFPNKEN